MITSHEKQINLQEDTKRADVNESLLRWIQKDYLRNSTGTGDKSLWAEWTLVEALLSTLEFMFPHQMFNSN